jgi:hypothetical protein
MAAPRLYQFEQRSEGRGAVIRIGPSGGKKTVAVYDNQRTAEYIVNQLNHHKNNEV